VILLGYSACLNFEHLFDDKTNLIGDFITIKHDLMKIFSCLIFGLRTLVQAAPAEE